MKPIERVTAPTVDVLRCLIEASEPTWGLLVIKETQRPAGTIYPILERLERLGWVESAWDDATDRPGPRRRLYRLTADGLAAARTTVAAAQRPDARAARTSEAGA